jgi:hypothetical protein
LEEGKPVTRRKVGVDERGKPRFLTDEFVCGKRRPRIADCADLKWMKYGCGNAETARKIVEKYGSV